MNDCGLIRIARLGPNDLAYPAGARWAVLGLKWAWPEVPEGGRMVGAKVRSLEEAIALAERAEKEPHLIDGAREFDLAGDPAPVEFWRREILFYRKRRAAGHVPKPPSSWSDIFVNPEVDPA